MVSWMIIVWSSWHGPTGPGHALLQYYYACGCRIILIIETRTEYKGYAYQWTYHWSISIPTELKRMGVSVITPGTLQAQGLFLAVLIAILRFSASDLAQDRAECTEPLVGLATCLPYVRGDGKAPTPDCCSGLGQVLQKNFKCLCVLVKDRDEPSLGLKINTTLALGLPSSCHTPVNISQCIGK